MSLFGGLEESVYLCKKCSINVLITYAPRMALERSDSDLPVPAARQSKRSGDREWPWGSYSKTPYI